MQGETLTALRGDIADHDGLTLLVGELTDTSAAAYQWIRRDGGTDTDIAGATGRTYQVTGDDVGKTLKVRVSFKDDGGNSESRTSAATAAVPTPTLTSSNVTSTQAIIAVGNYTGDWYYQADKAPDNACR